MAKERVVKTSRPPDSVLLAADDLIICSECVPDVQITRLPAGVWEIRAVHSEVCCLPEELVYV